MSRLDVVGDETADELVAALLFGADADAEDADAARWRAAS